MFELSHQERLNILGLLKEEPHRLSHMSKKLGITTAEVSRHLDRLGRAGLIERDGENNYYLTPFAIIVLLEVSKFDFLTQHMEYFLTHDITIIPEHLLWLTSIAKGEFINGTLEISSMIKDTSLNARRYINVISTEIMRGIIELDCTKHDEGVVFRKIYPAGEDLPPEYEKRLGDTFQVRTMEQIPMALKMNESIAGVALNDRRGKIDFSLGIVGEDESFRRWVKAVFEYYWNIAKVRL
jgi:predicted transcriptional regulator